FVRPAGRTRMTSATHATIEQVSDGSFAVIVDGEIARAGFVGRGHATMWAARRGLYRANRARPVAKLPADLEDQRILKSPVAAKLVGKSYGQFLIESRAGKWGPRVQLGTKSFGHSLGDLKRGLMAAQIK